MTVLSTNFENLFFLTQLNKPEYHEGFIWNEELWSHISEEIESGKYLSLGEVVIQGSMDGFEIVTGYNRLLTLIIAYNVLLNMGFGMDGKSDLFNQNLKYDEGDPKQKDAYEYFWRSFEVGVKYGLSEQKTAAMLRSHIFQMGFDVVILEEGDDSAESIYTKSKAIAR